MGKFCNQIINTFYNAQQFDRGSINYCIKDSENNLHFIFLGCVTGATGVYELVYRKYTFTTNSWNVPVNIYGSPLPWDQVSVWYDRWSGIAADIIHVVGTDSNNADIVYWQIAALTGVVTYKSQPLNGTSVATGGCLSITRARGGNIGIAYCIDAGVEYGFLVSTNVGTSWTAKSNAVWEGATQDQVILLPSWNADNQDMMAFFWDASADEISRKLYDSSANSWAESSIATTMVDTPATTSFPHFAATVDLTNSRNLLVAWSAVDTANADLRCWYITEAAITEVTNVVLNSTDDQELCAIGIDTRTEYWYVFYAGKSDGSETVTTSLKIYYKVSQDAGTTWGTETALTTVNYNIKSLWCTPRFYANPCLAFITTSGTIMLMETLIPSATYQLGL